MQRWSIESSDSETKSLFSVTMHLSGLRKVAFLIESNLSINFKSQEQTRGFPKRFKVVRFSNDWITLKGIPSSSLSDKSRRMRELGKEFLNDVRLFLFKTNFFKFKI